MSDDLKLIKSRILEEGRVEDIYEAIGCEFVKYVANRVEAQLPEGFMSDNRRAVQTKLNDNLSSSIRNRGDFKGGDIFSLVSYIHHEKRGKEIDKDLYNAKRFICETLGWTEFLKGGDYKTKKDYVAPLKAILKKEGITKKREIKENPVLPDDVMNQFYPYGKPLPFKSWIEEGISYNTQVRYGVGFDLESKRIVFPLKNSVGKIVGVKGRIVDDNLDDRKYLYIYRCDNRYEWFNYHIALTEILITRKVYIVESEKSAMKLYDVGVRNVLAIGASDMSWEQSEILKNIGLDIEIILCYDKGISVEEIVAQAELYKGRKISMMYDMDNILEHEKSAPIDEGLDKWNKLVESYIFPISLDDEDYED